MSKDNNKMDAIAERAGEIFERRFNIEDILKGDVHEMHSECMKQAIKELKEEK